MTTLSIAVKLSAELNISLKQIESTIALLEEGNTIPFISRYRKEATGSLDEVQVRQIQERSDYFKELNERRETILSSIESQGKLTDELKKKITECDVKNELEDLYLPYKPKRRTKATIAKEKGLEPLAERIRDQCLSTTPTEEAKAFVSEEKGVADVNQALEGARHIVAEWISENADIRAFVREVYSEKGIVVSEVRKEFKDKPTKFQQYYDFSESIKNIPSHRYLAIRRGEKEEVLTMKLVVDEERILGEMTKLCRQNERSPYCHELSLAIADSFKRLISTSVETEVRVSQKMLSDVAAVDIFAENLRNLLLSAPMGGKSVIGIDPGLRTGCKIVSIDETGKFLDKTTLFLTSGSGAQAKAKGDLISFVKRFSPRAIAIGNGTASRETETFVRETLKEAAIDDLIVVQVSEAGASVYSASDVAREEFPDLDLTYRGAISIARRLQDPLAELVKVEPKAIGVGQYQHDVFQPLLERKLNEVVESCVNLVGVDLNTTSHSLLSFVAGINAALAKKITAYRNENGPFKTRASLLKVPGLGAKTFEQSAGFLRIRDGENPLDASSVHPERYALVTQMSKDKNLSIKDLIGNKENVDLIDINTYKNSEVGRETLTDIINELKKPGRDPRKSFEMPKYRQDVTKPEDLQKGMILEGIVTNVTAFGAFVDIGVHQDGLVHVSALSHQFIKDPKEVVKAGDTLKVQVLEVNLELKRISLTAKIGTPAPAEKRPPGGKKPERTVKKEAFSNNPFLSLR